MKEKSNIITIHVYLLDEGTDVWRPVEAIHVAESVDQIIPASTIPEAETWQFSPGKMVRCEERRLLRGDCLVAIEKVKDSR